MGVANYSVPHIRADRDHEAYKVINLLQGQEESRRAACAEIRTGSPYFCIRREFMATPHKYQNPHYTIGAK